MSHALVPNWPSTGALAEGSITLRYSTGTLKIQWTTLNMQQELPDLRKGRRCEELARLVRKPQYIDQTQRRKARRVPVISPVKLLPCARPVVWCRTPCGKACADPCTLFASFFSQTSRAPHLTASKSTLTTLSRIWGCAPGPSCASAQSTRPQSQKTHEPTRNATVKSFR